MRDEKFENIKFKVTLPRYVLVKDSIIELMKIIDREKVKTDGPVKVMSAILQLIEENADKLEEEKYDYIKDAIYNGKVFSNYFSEENKEKAISVLSKTTLLDEEERFIYMINFYMPDDKAFSATYKECEKNIFKISKRYGFADTTTNRNLVLGRVIEINSFYAKYQAEKERQRMVYEHETLAALQDAEDNPTIENIEKVKNMIDELPNNDLKETLMSQLEDIEYQRKPLDSSDVPSDFEEITVYPLPEDDGAWNLESTSEPLNLEEFGSDLDETLEESISEEEITPIESLSSEEKFNELEIPEEEILEKTEFDLEKNVSKEDINPVEPNKTTVITLSQEEIKPSVGQDVMASLQKIVADAKQNANKVEEQEAVIQNKDKLIEKQNEEITAQGNVIKEQKSVIENQEDVIKEQNGMIELQNKEIENQKNVIGEQTKTIENQENVIQNKDEKINELESTVKEKDIALANVDKVIASKDNELAEKDSQIDSLNKTLESYKASLAEIQAFLASSQPEIANAPKKML